MTKAEFIEIIKDLETKLLNSKRQFLTLRQNLSTNKHGNLDDHLWLIENNYLPPFDEYKLIKSSKKGEIVLLVWYHSEGQSSLDTKSESMLQLIKLNSDFLVKWNTSLLKIYGEKKSKLYRTATEKYNFWFDRKHIVPNDSNLIYQIPVKQKRPAKNGVSEITHKRYVAVNKKYLEIKKIKDSSTKKEISREMARFTFLGTSYSSERIYEILNRKMWQYSINPRGN